MPLAILLFGAGALYLLTLAIQEYDELEFVVDTPIGSVRAKGQRLR